MLCQLLAYDWCTDNSTTDIGPIISRVVKLGKPYLGKTAVLHSTRYAPCELHFGQIATDEIKIIKFPPGKELSHDLFIMNAGEYLRNDFEKKVKNRKILIYNRLFL